MIGKQFGPYKIEAKIGEGGMGVVYRAMDTELDRPVAIKMVHATAGATGSEADESVSRFMREAKASSRLQHPAITTIYQFGVEENTRYLAMEFIDGKTLKRIVSNHPMALNEACEIAIQVADGLAAAHEKGVIHRDLKAENIMVTPRGQAKILDFGLAKIAQPEQVATDITVDDYYKTQIGTVLGTVSNMSPEQALGHDVDEKADVFSLGIVVYEMVTGKNPFLGPSAQATMARILNQEPELASEVNPSVPPELESLIHLCLRKDPKQRPSSKQVTSELKRILASLSARELAPEPLGSQTISQVQSGPRISSPSASGSFRPQSQTIASQSPVDQKRKLADHPAILKNIGTIHRVLKMVRIAIGLFTLSIPFSFLLYMLVSGGLIRPQFVEGTTIWEYIKMIVVPSLTAAENILTVRPIVNGWNLMLAGLAGVGFVVRHIVMLPFEQAEHWAKTRMLKARSVQSGSSTRGAAPEQAVQNRLALLREYSESQNRLYAGKQHLAFLSVDIVGSTKMKQGEDKLVVEHAFVEYRKFLERILKTHNVWKFASTPDGTMAAFQKADDAVCAAQAVLKELDWFNDGVHRLRSRFSVRCGVNVGEVIFPPDKNLEEITDEVIDVAGHMQKYATADSLWVAKDALKEVADPAGFHMIEDRQVDNRTAFEWRKPGNSAAASAD
jgi:serine/threonine protein kinase/class 3 adenylate cyclase